MLMLLRHRISAGIIMIATSLGLVYCIVRLYINFSNYIGRAQEITSIIGLGAIVALCGFVIVGVTSLRTRTGVNTTNEEDKQIHE